MVAAFHGCLNDTLVVDIMDGAAKNKQKACVQKVGLSAANSPLLRSMAEYYLTYTQVVRCERRDSISAGFSFFLL